MFDDDLLSLMEEKPARVEQDYRLEYLQTEFRVPALYRRPRSKCAVKGEIAQEAACGDGPVDAVYKAIDKITKRPVKLLDYKLAAVSGGKDAQGEVTVQLEVGEGHTVRGKGTSTDIIEASAKAYLAALNRIASRGPRKTDLAQEKVDGGSFYVPATCRMRNGCRCPARRAYRGALRPERHGLFSLRSKPRYLFRA